MRDDAELTIQALQADDFDAWLDLWKDYQAFYHTDVPDAATEAAFARMIDPQDPCWGALGRVGGRPLGLVHVIRHKSNWTVGDYAYLQDLFVSEAARGKGLGRALIEHVYARATSEACANVYWLTAETNWQARQLYDRVARRTGFLEYEKQF
jgi:GNAT superfamily N-acetyltransferase